MSNCEQNCEAVSNLNEYAANLIEYSKRIDSWLNGPQDAMVDVGGVPTPTLRNLVMALKFLSIEKFVQSGGGLSIDDDGKMYLDFSTMPKEKYEIILKQIRVPIWLSGNTVFYVNNSHPDASDSLEESGRGLSPDLPFKTIQAAINYVANNYNMINFYAYIRIAAGNYNENLTLGNFSYTTGGIIIEPYPGQEGQVNINMSGLVGVNCRGGKYYLYNLNLTMKPIWSDPIIPAYPALINNYGELHLRACHFTMTDMSGITANANVDLRMIVSFDNNILYLVPSIANERQMYIKFAKPANKNLHVILAQAGAEIRTPGSNISQAVATILCEGTATDFIRIEFNSRYIVGPGYLYDAKYAVPAGKSVICQKYTLTWGSSCTVLGKGQDYFPGNTAGSVQESTYCWYQ